MPDLRVSVVNFPGHGELFSTVGVPEGGQTRNHIPLSLAGYAVDLYQRREIITQPVSAFRGETRHTTDVFVRDVAPADVANANAVVEDLCQLLTFASGSPVAPFRYEYQGKGHVQGARGTLQFFRPSIEILDGVRTREFIQRTWTGFQKFKSPRKLPLVFEYLWRAEEEGQPLEVRLLLVFVTLENLKSTFAHSKGVPFVDGFFRRVSSPPKPNPADEKTYGFKALTEWMLKEKNMTPTLSPLIGLRNEIIHSGLSELPIEQQMQLYDDTQAIVQEYILHLLGYHGLFHDYAKMACRTIP